MTRGGGYPWYGQSSQAEPPNNTMTYECDTKLGNPSVVDCSQLQYSQLGKSTESLALRPGVVDFLHSGSCNVAISASAPMVLSWAQIKAALDELVELCVNNPVATAVGGKAFYGAQSSIDLDLGGGRKRKRKRDITGLNALPAHANITLFQQLEISDAFPDDPDETQTCTWQNVLAGEDVRLCQNVHHHRPRPPPASSPPPPSSSPQQCGGPCTAPTDCDPSSNCICALSSDSSSSSPPVFTCTYIEIPLPATGTCRGHCLLANGSSSSSSTTVVALDTTASTSPIPSPSIPPIPPNLTCPCNCTYVSHACCTSSTTLVWEPPALKINVTVPAPNGTVCCDAETGRWVTAEVQRDVARGDTACGVKGGEGGAETGGGGINF
ncbi:hypothetical protein MMC24_006520 [Lignoscripta atroalba]|nr:hypothetical protein [Lignoscripta atroalba]